MTEQQRDRVDINWVQVSASALAAVSSAVLLSTVGVAGTIIGAAVGSVVATAGSAIYSHYLRMTRERVAQGHAAALDRVARARSGASGAWAESRRAEARQQRTQVLQVQNQAGDELDEAERELDDVSEDVAKPTWRELLAGLRWKRITAVAGAIFVVAMLVIVSFELITGRAVSQMTGGSDAGTRTSIPGLGHHQSVTTPVPTPSADPSGGTSPSATTGATPGATPGATSSPTGTPTPSPSASPTTPTPTAAPTTGVPAPSATPTTGGTPATVPTPTAGLTPAG